MSTQQMTALSFEPLQPEHYSRLKPFFGGQNLPLSAYSLASLVAWSQCIFDTFFAVGDGALLIAERRMDVPQIKHLLLPVAPSGLKPPEWLRDCAVSAGYREYHFIPHTYLESFGVPAVERFFTITEEPEYEDYVYRVSDLAGLLGRDYAKKRNLVRQFEREYLEPGRVEVRAITPENAADCLTCLEGWRASRQGKDWTDVLECERQAIVKALRNFRGCELEGIAVAIDSTVRGFGIGSRLTADTWVLNFEKASDQVKGLYQFLDRECARRLFPGAVYLNKESDMGDMGLAKAKQSYVPAFRVKSFILELRQAGGTASGI